MSKQNKADVDPEALYRQYRQHRLNIRDANLDGESSRVAAMATDQDGETERLYQLYRTNRVADRELAINEILWLIDNEAEVNESVTDGVVAVDSRPWYAKLFTLPGDLFKKLTDGASVLRYGIPALAACLLAVLVIPMLVSQPTNKGLVPDSLVSHADSVVQYVDPSTATSFGFSGTDSTEKGSFGRGVLTTAVSVLSQSADTEETREKLAVMRNKLGSVQSADSKSAQEWFEMGSAIESISLAAQYAIDSAETKPLSDALDILKSTVSPRLSLAPSRIIEELKSETIEEDIDFAQIRSILDKTRNIKLLMQ